MVLNENRNHSAFIIYIFGTLKVIMTIKVSKVKAVGERDHQDLWQIYVEESVITR